MENFNQMTELMKQTRQNMECFNSKVQDETVRTWERQVTTTKDCAEVGLKQCQTLMAEGINNLMMVKDAWTETFGIFTNTFETLASSATTAKSK